MKDILKLKLITKFKLYWRGLVDAKKRNDQWSLDWYYLRLDEIIDMLDLAYPDLNTSYLSKLATNYRFDVKEIKQ